VGYLVYDIEAVVDGTTCPAWEPPEGAPDTFPPVWAFRIATIGTLTLDDALNVTGAGVCGPGSGGDEVEILESWLAQARDANGRPHKLVDFNGRGFDIPLIQNRCWKYGLDMSWYFAPQPDNRGSISTWSKAYRERYAGMHIDIAEQYSNFRAAPYHSLDALAQLMGLPGKAISLGGAEVGKAWAEGRHADIDRYVMEDVLQTAFVFLRMKLLFGEIALERYRGLAASLLDRIKNGTRYTHLSDAVDEATLLLEERCSE